MADVSRGSTRLHSSRMLGSNGAKHLAIERSRERRRRRMEMRRNSGTLPPAAAADADVLPLNQNNGGGGAVAEQTRTPVVSERTVVLGIPMKPPCFSWQPGVRGPVIRNLYSGPGRQLTMPPRPPPRKNAVPVVGAVAVAGRQIEMEDAVAIHTNLCSPAINLFHPVHFFGLYDGHGGSHFANFCKDKMHATLKEELMGGQSHILDQIGPRLPRPGMISEESLLQEIWRIMISRVYSITEMLAISSCKCGSVDFCSSCDRDQVSCSGTTAVAIVLTDRHIVAGNCGDSRAVLYRGGRIIPLTFDHKPDRAGEQARIEASGGEVIYTDTARVQGVLAMSRAIGDLYLKPYIVSEPEVTFTRRDQEDEFIIIASDGLWDVIPTNMAGRIVRECLTGAQATVADGGAHGFNQDPDENVHPSRSALAASLLTRLALARGTGDNVSVVVIDLKRVARG